MNLSDINIVNLTTVDVSIAICYSAVDLIQGISTVTFGHGARVIWPVILGRGRRTVEVGHIVTGYYFGIAPVPSAQSAS